MELNKLIILDPDTLPQFAKLLAEEVKKILQEENKKLTKETRLNLKQLVEVYGYSDRYFRDVIPGKFGRKDRNGRLSATIAEADDYFFGGKY